MTTRHTDDFIKYLTSGQNLPYTLDILRQGEAIRRRVLLDFWHSVREGLRNSVPSKLRSQQLQWDLWPGDQKMDASYAGLYCCPLRFKKRPQRLSYCLLHHSGSERFQLYLGLSWEQPLAPRSRLLKLPAVQKLATKLLENEFKQSRWQLGWKYIYPDEQRDAFLLKHAKRGDEILRDIRESFWPLVQETYKSMMKANEAIRRAG